MKKVLRLLPSIIFNIIELLIIYIFGTILKVSIQDMILILMFFALTTNALGGQLHYKDWRKCLIWSTLVFISFFLLIKIDIKIALSMVMFSAIILTNKGNINTSTIE